MTSAPTLSASSTSAEPGLRVRIRPVRILIPRTPCLDARALEHRAPDRLLLLQTGLEGELAWHGQHEDRVYDAVPRRSAWRRSPVPSRSRRRRRSGRAPSCIRAPRSRRGARAAADGRTCAGQGPAFCGSRSSRTSRRSSRGYRRSSPRRAAPPTATHAPTVPIPPITAVIGIKEPFIRTSHGAL